MNHKQSEIKRSRYSNSAGLTSRSYDGVTAKNANELKPNKDKALIESLVVSSETRCGEVWFK